MINAAWLQVVMIAVDLLTWTRTLLQGALARAEPRTLRYRLLHVAPASPMANDGAGHVSSAAGPGPASSPPSSTDFGP